MNLGLPGGYGRATLYATGLHIVVIAAFLVPWNLSEHKVPEPVPQHMMAQVVQEENKAFKERKEKERQRQAEQARKKREADKRRKAEAAKQAKLKAEKKRKAEAEKKRKAEALAKQQAAEKLAQEKAAQQAAKEKAEQEQQQREEQMLRQLEKEQAAQALAEQMAAEQAAAEQAARMAQMELDVSSQIRAKVESFWRYPPAVRADQEVVIGLQLVPTGEVVQVNIIRSSGNTALDRSVEQAIFQASPLPVPEDIRVFERSFRSFNMTFRPENASW